MPQTGLNLSSQIVSLLKNEVGFCDCLLHDLNRGNFDEAMRWANVILLNRPPLQEAITMHDKSIPLQVEQANILDGLPDLTTLATKVQNELLKRTATGETAAVLKLKKTSDKLREANGIC